MGFVGERAPTDFLKALVRTQVKQLKNQESIEVPDYNPANDSQFRYLTTTGPLQQILIDGFKVPEHVTILRLLNLDPFFCE